MDWSPFRVAAPGELPPAPRSLKSREGVGDRLRAAAFAELQAREAFLWAADRYGDAPPGLAGEWRRLAAAEDRHLGWLLGRLKALALRPEERPVSDRLWRSLTACPDACSFAAFMAAAEERGRQAGERFREALSESDPETARIFGAIAEEEVSHVALASRYFPAT